MASAEPLVKLRALLREHRLDGYIVPTQDAHSSEYIAACDGRREFLSGFTGSAGTALVTDSAALLWTDGRYHLHARRELSDAWTLMPQGEPDCPSMSSYISNTFPGKSARIGIDPTLVSISGFSNIPGLTGVDSNLVDQVWPEKPAVPCNPVYDHPVEYSGSTSKEKLAKVRQSMTELGADAVVLTALDEIAWITNLRGSDIACNPVFFAYAIVTLDQAYLFMDSSRLTGSPSGFSIQEYSQVYSFLESYSGVVWMDPSQCNYKIYSTCKDSCVLQQSPVQMLKAVKNPVELAGMRNAHLKDAVAKIKFLAWLEKEVTSSNSILTEYACAEKLLGFRQQQPLFMGVSFDTISSSGPNGAVIHYSPARTGSSRVTAEEMYLVDSGGQYRDGTTDVTRTVHFGRPSAFQKECYTRVLKGHIGLARVVFPYGTSGPTLDVLARQHLWEAGLEYKHGTGHGIGAFLNVHEGPHGISATTARAVMASTALEPGMLVTDEPGYYHEGEFGIRIENVLEVVEASTPYHYNGMRFLTFNNITLIPLCANLIQRDMLSTEDIVWINSLHREVMQKVAPFLQDDKETLEWLQAACALIE